MEEEEGITTKEQKIKYIGFSEDMIITKILVYGIKGMKINTAKRRLREFDNSENMKVIS